MKRYYHAQSILFIRDVYTERSGAREKYHGPEQGKSKILRSGAGKTTQKWKIHQRENN